MKFSKLSTAILAAGVVLPGLAFATNGDNLIGLGPMSRALGGTGVAAFYGSENALTNPALLGKMKGTEFAIGATAFMPDVHASMNALGPASAKSKGSLFAIPEVSLATRLNDHWTFGLGMYGVSGMGVDYRGNTGLLNAYSNLQMMQFVPSITYNTDRYGIGFAPIAQYGALDIHYAFNPPPGAFDNGSKSDFGFGYNLGGYYDVTRALTLGVDYQSKIDMNYAGVISSAGLPMGQTFSDQLDQPAQFKLGAAYTFGHWMVTGDYKKVFWGDATGYKDFNWKNQNVYALGAKYSGHGWWAGAGYNYGKDPIGNDTNPNGPVINMFNNLFFPAIVESHYTLGGGISLNKHMSIDLAYVHAAKVSKTVATPFGGAPETTTHSQDGVTVSLRMDF